jgi:hypothetical protein
VHEEARRGAFGHIGGRGQRGAQIPNRSGVAFESNLNAAGATRYDGFVLLLGIEPRRIGYNESALRGANSGERGRGESLLSIAEVGFGGTGGIECDGIFAAQIVEAARVDFPEIVFEPGDREVSFRRRSVAEEEAAAELFAAQALQVRRLRWVMRPDQSAGACVQLFVA